MVQFNFNANDHEPSEDRGDFGLIEPGWYDAEITGSEMKTTKAGTGQYLKFEWTILGPKFAGRKVWANLNIVNPNPKAVEIAHRELSTVSRAVGVLSFTDSAQLHNKPCKIRVKTRPAKNGYDASDEIGGYKPRDADVPMPSAPSANGSSGDGRPAWAR